GSAHVAAQDLAESPIGSDIHRRSDEGSAEPARSHDCAGRPPLERRFSPTGRARQTHPLPRPIFVLSAARSRRFRRYSLTSSTGFALKISFADKPALRAAHVPLISAAYS